MKVRGVHYERSDEGRWLMLAPGPDGAPRVPKVPLTADWLHYKNWADHDVEPSKDTFRSCLCTPYIYSQYSAIFGVRLLLLLLLRL